jgi:hypothetical protein
VLKIIRKYIEKGHKPGDTLTLLTRNYLLISPTGKVRLMKHPLQGVHTVKELWDLYEVGDPMTKGELLGLCKYLCNYGNHSFTVRMGLRYPDLIDKEEGKAIISRELS